jgi:WD40 repeat protein
MALPEPPQGEPRQVLQAIWDHAFEMGEWPTFAQLDHRWDAAHDSDVLDVLRQLPPGFTHGDNFRSQPQGSTVVGLTVAGANCCQGAAEALSVFIDFIRVATSIQRAWQPLPGHPEAQPVITDLDYVRQAHALHTRRGRRRREQQLPQYGSQAQPGLAGGEYVILSVRQQRLLTLLQLLIHAEPSLWTGLGGPNAEGHWQASLHRNIRRFRNITSLDEYWALRHKPWEQLAQDPAAEESSTGTDASPAATFAANRKAVMVIYGHDLEARDALFDWLRAIGLQPREWNQLVSDSGAASPYIGQVLDHAFQQAQAVIALFTPDDRVRPRGQNGPWRLQARPNVLIEAGMALVTHPTRTVLAVLGPQELPSDLAGRHYVHLSPTSSAPLHDLANRLQRAGCETDTTGNDWLKPDRFPNRDHIPQIPTVGNTGAASRTTALTVNHKATLAKPRPWPIRLTRTLTGHKGALWGVAFNPDGTLLATTSSDKTTRLWDVGTGQPARTLTGHEAAVFGVAFSPEGGLLATASDDDTARLWDIATGQPVRTLNGHENDVNKVAFSPDGTLLATASSDRTARLWDVATGEPARTFTGHEKYVNDVAFSPDGTLLATASGDHTARLWDVATGQPPRTFTVHESDMVGVAFSPDGTLLATTSADTTALLWDVATGQPTHTLTGHEGVLYGVAFSPDGTLLATASADQTARLWDPATGKCLRVLIGHADFVRDVAFSPDGTLLASVADDSTVRLWS